MLALKNVLAYIDCSHKKFYCAGPKCQNYSFFYFFCKVASCQDTSLSLTLRTKKLVRLPLATLDRLVFNLRVRLERTLKKHLAVPRSKDVLLCLLTNIHPSLTCLISLVLHLCVRVEPTIVERVEVLRFKLLAPGTLFTTLYFLRKF